MDRKSTKKAKPLAKTSIGITHSSNVVSSHGITGQQHRSMSTSTKNPTKSTTPSKPLTKPSKRRIMNPIMIQSASMGLIKKRPSTQNDQNNTSNSTPSSPIEDKSTSFGSFGNNNDNRSGNRGRFDHGDETTTTHSTKNQNFKQNSQKMSQDESNARLKSQFNKFNGGSTGHGYGNSQYNGFDDNDDGLNNARFANDMAKKHSKRTGGDHTYDTNSQHRKGQFGNDNYKKRNNFGVEDGNVPNFVREKAAQFTKTLASTLLSSTQHETDDRTKRFSAQADKAKRVVNQKMENDRQRYEQQQLNQDNAKKPRRSNTHDDHHKKFDPALSLKQQRDRRLKEIKSIEKKKKILLEQVNSFLLGGSKSRVSPGTYRTTYDMLKTVNNSTSIEDIENELSNSPKGNHAVVSATKAKKLTPFVITWNKLGLEPFVYTKLQQHPLQKKLAHNYSHARIQHEQRRLRFVQEYLYREIQARLSRENELNGDEFEDGLVTTKNAKNKKSTIDGDENIDEKIDENIDEKIDANIIGEDDEIPDEVLAKHNVKEIVRKMPISLDTFDTILDSALQIRTPTSPHDSLYDTEELLKEALVNADASTKHLISVYLKVKKYLHIGQQFAELRDDDADDADDDEDDVGGNNNNNKSKKSKKSKKLNLPASALPSIPELSAAQLDTYMPSLPLLPSALQISLLPHMVPYKNKDRGYQSVSPVSMQSFLHLKHQFENDPRELVIKVHDYPDDFLDTYELHGTKDVSLEHIPPSSSTMRSSIGISPNNDPNAPDGIDNVDQTHVETTAMEKYYRPDEQKTPYPKINGFHPLVTTNNYRRLTPAIPNHTYDLVFQHYDQNERIMAYLPGIIQSITSRPVVTPNQQLQNLGIKAVILQPNRESCVYVYNHIQTMLGSINQAQELSTLKGKKVEQKETDNKKGGKNGKNDTNERSPQSHDHTRPYHFNAMRASGNVGRRTIERIEKSPPDILVLTPQALSQLLSQSDHSTTTAHEKLKYHRRVARRQAQKLQEQKQIDDLDDGDDMRGLVRLVVQKGNLAALQKLHSYGITFDPDTGAVRKMTKKERKFGDEVSLASLEAEEKLILMLQTKFKTSSRGRKWSGFESTIDDIEDEGQDGAAKRRYNKKRVDFDDIVEDFDPENAEFDDENDEYGYDDGSDEEFEVSNPHGEEDQKLQSSFTKTKTTKPENEDNDNSVSDENKNYTVDKRGRKVWKKSDSVSVENGDENEQNDERDKKKSTKKSKREENQDDDKEFEETMKKHLANDPMGDEHLTGEAADLYQSLPRSQKKLFSALHAAQSSSIEEQLKSINSDLSAEFGVEIDLDKTKKAQDDDEDGENDDQKTNKNDEKDADFDPIAHNTLYAPKRLFNNGTDDVLLSHQRSANSLGEDISPSSNAALYRFFETDQERDDLKRLYSLKNCSGDHKPLLFNLNWLVMDNAEKLVNHHYHDLRSIVLHVRYLRRLQGKYPSHDVSRIAMGCSVVNESALVVAATALRDAVFVNGCHLDVQSSPDTNDIKDDEIAVETRSVGASTSNLIENIDNSTYSIKELFQFNTEPLITNRHKFRNDLMAKAKILAPGLAPVDDNDANGLDDIDADDTIKDEPSTPQNERKQSRHAKRVTDKIQMLDSDDIKQQDHDRKQLEIISKQSTDLTKYDTYVDPDIQPNTMPPEELDGAINKAINSVHLLQQGTLVSPSISHTYMVVGLPHRLRHIAATIAKRGSGIKLYNHGEFRNATHAKKNKMVGFERLKTQVHLSQALNAEKQRNSVHIDDGIDGDGAKNGSSIVNQEGNEIKLFTPATTPSTNESLSAKKLITGLSRNEVAALKHEELQYQQLMRLQQQQKLDIMKSQAQNIAVTVVDEHELLEYMTKKLQLNIDTSRGDGGGKYEKDGHKQPRTNIAQSQRAKILKDYNRIELNYARQCDKLRSMHKSNKLSKQVMESELRRAGSVYKTEIEKLKIDLSTIGKLVREYREDVILSSVRLIQKQEIQLLKRQHGGDVEGGNGGEIDTMEGVNIDGISKNKKNNGISKHDLHRKITPTRVLMRTILDAIKQHDIKMKKNKGSLSKRADLIARQALKPDNQKVTANVALTSPLGIDIELPQQLNWFKFYDHSLSRSVRRTQDSLNRALANKANPDDQVVDKNDQKNNKKPKTAEQYREMHKSKNKKQSTNDDGVDDDDLGSEEHDQNDENIDKNDHKNKNGDKFNQNDLSSQSDPSRPHPVHIDYDNDDKVPMEEMIPNGHTVINTNKGIVAYTPEFSALSDLELLSEYASIQANTVSRLHASLKPRSTIVVLPPNTPFDALAMMFSLKKLKPGILHHSQDKTAKKHVQEAFGQHKINVLLCTDHSIHGMGDIKADLVVSWGVPTTSQYIYRSQLLSNSSTGAHVSIQEANTGVGDMSHMLQIPKSIRKLMGEDVSDDDDHDGDKQGEGGQKKSKKNQNKKLKKDGQNDDNNDNNNDDDALIESKNESDGGDESDQDEVLPSLPSSTHVSPFSSQLQQKTEIIFDEIRDLLGVRLDRSFLINGQLFPAVEEEVVEYIKPVKDKHAHHYWDKYAHDENDSFTHHETNDIDAQNDPSDDVYISPLTGKPSKLPKGFRQAPGEQAVKIVNAKQIYYSPFPIQITRFTSNSATRSLVPEFNTVFSNNNIRDAIQGDKDLYSELINEAVEQLTPNERVTYYSSSQSQKESIIVKKLHKTHRDELVHLGLMGIDEVIEDEKAKEVNAQATKKPRVGLMSRFKRIGSNIDFAQGDIDNDDGDDDFDNKNVVENDQNVDKNGKKVDKKNKNAISNNDNVAQTQPLSQFEQLLQQAVEMDHDDDKSTSVHSDDGDGEEEPRFELASVYQQKRDSLRAKFAPKATTKSFVFEQGDDDDMLGWGDKAKTKSKSNKILQDDDLDAFVAQENDNISDVLETVADDVVENIDIDHEFNVKNNETKNKSMKKSNTNQQDPSSQKLLQRSTPLDISPVDLDSVDNAGPESDDENDASSLPTVRMNKKTLSSIGKKQPIKRIAATAAFDPVVNMAGNDSGSEMSDSVDFEFEFDDKEEKLYSNYLTKHKATLSDDDGDNNNDSDDGVAYQFNSDRDDDDEIESDHRISKVYNSHGKMPTRNGDRFQKKENKNVPKYPKNDQVNSNNFEKSNVQFKNDTSQKSPFNNEPKPKFAVDVDGDDDNGDIPSFAPPRGKKKAFTPYNPSKDPKIKQMRESSGALTAKYMGDNKRFAEKQRENRK